MGDRSDDSEHFKKDHKINKTFRVLYANARSIIGKIDLLRTDVCDIKPDMVMICEAGTHSGISDAVLALPGYSMKVRSDGQDTINGWCRGLLIWVREGVKAGRYESDLIKDLVECKGVTIPWGRNGALLTVLLCYRPPSYAGGLEDNGYSDMFCKLLSEIRGQVVICGYLNFWSKSGPEGMPLLLAWRLRDKLRRRVSSCQLYWCPKVVSETSFAVKAPSVEVFLYFNKFFYLWYHNPMLIILLMVNPWFFKVSSMSSRASSSRFLSSSLVSTSST